MENHVRALGLIYLIYHAIALIIGALVFFLLSGIGILSGDLEAAGILGVIGIGILVIMAVLATPGIIAGFGLLARKNWARILAMILGGLHLLEVPIGTALGVYTLWVLTHEDVTPLFGSY
jgi:hypothetical protein